MESLELESLQSIPSSLSGTAGTSESSSSSSDRSFTSMAERLAGFADDEDSYSDDMDLGSEDDEDSLRQNHWRVGDVYEHG